MTTSRTGAFLAVLILAATVLAGCAADSDAGEGADGASDAPASSQTQTAPASDPASLIYPEDLEYLGAFRLSEGEDYEVRTWEWADGSITYSAGGDAGGAKDGHPGSLYGIGHAQHFFVSEVGIPAPVVSRDVADLPTAQTLQGFQDVFGEFVEGLEIPVGGIEYATSRDGDAARLHLAWGQWLQYELDPSRAWANADLSSADTAGPWYLGDIDVRGSSDYVFSIPEEWAAAYAEGRTLATGRFKDGGQGGQGPTLFAYAPWEVGDPPEDGAVLPATTLLQYDTADSGGTDTLAGYEHSDQWLAGEWMSSGTRAAIAFVGTKGIDEDRETWYGYADGGDGEDAPPEDLPDNEKGWWSDRFEGQVLFYDPAALAAVALGQADPSSPQPYAVMRIDEHLLSVTHDQQKEHVVGAAFDPGGGYLYVVEPFADGDRPIVHVWGLSDQ